MLKRAILVGALMLVFGGLMAGAQARSLDEIIKSGTVRIGVGANQPP